MFYNINIKFLIHEKLYKAGIFFHYTMCQNFPLNNGFCMGIPFQTKFGTYFASILPCLILLRPALYRLIFRNMLSINEIFFVYKVQY